MLVRMTSAKNTHYDTDLLETLSQRVVVGDGPWGRSCRRQISRSMTSTTGADAVETKYVRLQSR
jgi:hypothetical protein